VKLWQQHGHLDGEKIAYAMSMGIPQEYEIFTMDVEWKESRPHF
jgi:hypothetical protein